MSRASFAKPRMPMTGDEFLASLRDDREVWVYGERVRDVTAHPAFRNVARIVARLYDALHDPATQPVLTVPTDTGSGGYTHRFFRSPTSVEDLRGARDAIAAWARMSYGWLGRSPDYKSSFLATLESNAEFYSPYEANARRWYREAQEQVLFFNHAIVNPPINRGLPPHETRDVFVHVERETDRGIVVSGAKVVATGSALTNYTFISQYATLPIQDEALALAFVVPTGAPGVKLLCRPSYAMTAGVMGSPFDYPLSSRFDENDAILVLEDVLVPWEDVLIYRDIERAQQFLPRSGFAPRAFFHGCVRLAVKLDFIAGLLLRGVEVMGNKDFRGVQAEAGEVMAWRNVFSGLADAMVHAPTPWKDGTVLPNVEYAMTYRALAPSIYPRIKGIIEKVLASSLVYVPSHAIDFEVPELRRHLDRIARGSDGSSALERAKLMKLTWDAVGTEFGGRHELYERSYGGNQENCLVELLHTAAAAGATDRCKELVARCMAEYDEKGWTAPDLIDAKDISLFGGRAGAPR
ncbi:4-hydroxyphenylacetate 3-hydroxylase N-terminal domain-containing protein [Sorangium sp. So ce134]